MNLNSQGVCAICQSPFRHVKEIERANGNAYHRSCARKAGVRKQYRGVTFSATRGKWLAYIQDPKRFGQKFRGPFDTELEAAQAYNDLAEQFYGDAAKLNVLDDDPPPPSPEEIAVACAEIRAAWTDEEYAARAPHLAAIFAEPLEP